MKSFIKQFVAVVTGDNAEAQAQKVLRQADSALKTQIAALQGDVITLEDAVENAKEQQVLAKVNHGRTITDRNSYVRGLLDAKNEVTKAEKALELHKEKIAFLESELATLDEVEESAVEAAK